MKILEEGRSYTFSDYAKLPHDPEDLLREFGVSLSRSFLGLPQSSKTLDRLDSLRDRLLESLPNIALTSEMSRREFLIAPVLIDVLHYCGAKLKVEYAVNLSDTLKGTFDYLIQNGTNLLVLEAKNDDLVRGATQLAIELVALHQLSPSNNVLYGAVSTGNIWQFSLFDSREMTIVQDINLYRVPADLEAVTRILVALLTAEENHALQPVHHAP